MKDNKNFFEIVAITHTDGIIYRLYSDGNVYYYDNSNNLIMLENKKILNEIMEYFEPPKFDM